MGVTVLDKWIPTTPAVISAEHCFNLWENSKRLICVVIFVRYQKVDDLRSETSSNTSVIYLKVTDLILDTVADQR